MKKIFYIYYETSISDEDFEYLNNLEKIFSSKFDEICNRFSNRNIQPVNYILDNLSDIIEDIHYYILDVN